MAYNNVFPVAYQPYYPQQNNNQQNGNLIWVQGEAGAKSYMVAPNNTVQLWDSERQTIYLKSADASGMPSMKTLDYTIRNEAEAPQTPLTGAERDFATKDDIFTIQEEIKALRGKLEALERGGRNAKHNANDKPASKFQK